MAAGAMLASQIFDLELLFQTLCAVVVSGAVWFVLKQALHRRKYSKLIPGKKVGFWDLLAHLNDFPLRESSRNGYSFNVFFLQVLGGHARLFHEHKLFGFWLSFAPFIAISKAEGVEAVLSGTKMMEKSWSYNFLHSWLGNGLLTSHGSKWKSRRKLLTPSFHFDILKDFLPIFNEQSQLLVKHLKEETDKEFTEIVTPVTLCSLDIICETTLGVSIGAQQNSESQYVKAVTRASDIIMERTVNCLHWPDFVFSFTQNGKQLKKDTEQLHSFTRSVIQEKKKKLLSGEVVRNKRMALMDLLLEHHLETKNLTEEDIREEVDTFAFEGHDTTSMGMSWALYLIGLHQDVQQKVHEELDRIFGDDDERFVTTDDLKDMKYLDCVLKESQRLYPSVPFTGRQVTEDTTICGYQIPKGASCMILTYFLHRDEKVFPNPEMFDPDRFLPENSIGRHPYAYVPFSAGPRNCIGQRFALMEEKIVVSTILRNYKLRSLDPRDLLPPAPELILRSSGPIRVEIRPRH